jgi:energy-coupling factor transport system ATP-binding protein
MRPKCIVLDEPTAMLDPKGRREVMETIKQLNEEMGITVVIITHYMDEAAMCNRIAIIDEGKVIMDSTPREVFAKVDEIKERMLDVPQVTELCHELKKEGFDLPDCVLNEEECVEALEKLLKGGAHNG